MTKEQAPFLVVVLLIVFASPIARAGGESCGKQDLVITGVVVGYDQLIQLANITSAPQVNVLVVRIEERIKGREESRYIKVIYEHLSGEATLPSEIFDGKNRWSFKLGRQTSCDSSLQALESASGKTEDGTEVSVPRLKRTPGAEAENIPADAMLPCYKLSPRDFKLSGSAR
jgi:hypothetical protein